jgi:hypothetical protein
MLLVTAVVVVAGDAVDTGIERSDKVPPSL